MPRLTNNRIFVLCFFFKDRVPVPRYPNRTKKLAFVRELNVNLALVLWMLLISLFGP